jgi:anthraniloyl-CoA monooxygenase
VPVVPWVLRQPLRQGGRTFAGRITDPAVLGDRIATVETDLADTWGAEADALVARCAGLLDAGAVGLRLTGPAFRTSLLRRLDLAERVRLDLADRATLVVVDGPRELLSDLAAGLLSARTDLVCIQNRSVS